MTAIAIGAATGAAGAAITGGDPLQGALLGGITGGMTYGLGGGIGTFGTESIGGSFINQIGGVFTTSGASFGGLAMQSAAGMAATGLAGSIGMGMLMPQQQDYNQAFTGMPYTPQAYNTQHTKVTGSGGRQAAAVLASEIKQAKSLRKRQAEASEGFGLDMDLAGTGLQIA